MPITESSRLRRPNRKEWGHVLTSLHWVRNDEIRTPSAPSARWMRANAHSHEYHEIVVSLLGSHAYGVDGQMVRLSPGAAVRIPARTLHDGWYGKHHAPCVDFWLHILPHGKVTANYIDHQPSRELVSTPVPWLTVQFQEDFSRGASLMNSADEIHQRKAAHFLLYLLYEVFEHLMTADSKLPQDNTTSVIEDIKLYATQHLTDRLTLHDLAKAAGYSPFHFHRIFLEEEGITPRAFVEACRLKNACDLLKAGFSITSAAMDSGFSTSSQFASVFKKKFGIPPSAWLKMVPHP